jgi:asparagine synthase (glutamine-hydrolysing)
MYSAREPIRPGALERATRRLAHRGPDGQRTWLADHRRVGLGHARLSIIDLATGDQPIAGEDEALRVVVNGIGAAARAVTQLGETSPASISTRSSPEIPDGSVVSAWRLRLFPVKQNSAFPTSSC